MMTRAAEMHRKGDYRGAIENYEAVRRQTEERPPSVCAKAAFLEGGARERLWSAGTDPREEFGKALEAFDEAIRLDDSELRVYAVESLLAKADMLLAAARRSSATNTEFLERGEECLRKLVDEPRWQVHPAVRRGIPHRMLAEILRDKEPHLAVDLFTQARDRQGDLEEGIENLSIAELYRDVLDQPDRAEECFERVRQNGLASGEDRRQAEDALKKLRNGMRAETELPEEAGEVLPEIDLEPWSE